MGKTGGEKKMLMLIALFYRIWRKQSSEDLEISMSCEISCSTWCMCDTVSNMTQMNSVPAMS